MNAHSARSTPPPPPPPPRPPRPAPHPVDPRRPRVLVAVAAGLVLGMSAALVVPAERVWTQAMVPAADRLHYGAALAPALTLAALVLYALVSVLLTPRRSYSPAGGRPGTKVTPVGADGGVGVTRDAGTDAAPRPTPLT